MSKKLKALDDAFGILDESPESLINKVPEALAPILKSVPYDLWRQDERTLTTLVNPSQQLRQIKVAFWREYDDAVMQGRQMRMINLVRGVCSYPYLMSKLENPQNVAWLCQQRSSYDIQLQETLEYGLDKLRDVLDLDTKVPKYNKEGDITSVEESTAIWKMKLDVIKMLDMRKHGGYTQRMESKNFNLSAKKDLDKEALSQEEIDQQIREAEERLRLAASSSGNGLVELAHNHKRKDAIVDTIVQDRKK